MTALGSQPASAALVQGLDLRPGQPGHVGLDLVADAGLQVGQVPVALRERASVAASSSSRAAGSTGSMPVLLVDRLAQHDAPAPVAASPGNRRSGRCKPRRTARRAPGPAGRSSSWSARWPGRPPRRPTCRPGNAGCSRPRSKPSWLTRMKSSAGPWNQVAIIRPSGCQTVRKRSQSPASRHTAQFSTRSRMASRSAVGSLIGPCLSGHVPRVAPPFSTVGGDRAWIR